VKLLKVLGSELKVKVSPSWLDKAGCPAALKYEYIDGKKDRFDVAAERGSAAHEAIADLTKLCLSRKCQPKDLSDEEVREAVNTHTVHRLLEEIPNILHWVEKWRDRYQLSNSMVGFEERMAINSDFEECSWDEADFRGIIDQIDINGSHCRVTDYKSQPNVLNRDDLDHHFQLTFYTWLVSKFYPFVNTFEVRIWYLRYGFWAGTPRTREQLEIFEKGLMLQVDKVMAIENWEPVPGSYCKWCRHTDVCPVGQPDDEGNFPLIPEAIITEEQARHYGSELRVVEQRREKLSALIRSYVKGREDPLKVSDNFAFGYKRSTSDFYPPDKVLEVLKEHGYSPGEYANFSAKTMKKLLKNAEKDHPALHRDLMEVAVQQSRTQFSGFDVK